MGFVDAMLDQLRVAHRIISEGAEVIPAWRIGTPRTGWLILSRFDHDQPAEQDRILHYIRRFMVSTLADSFILTGQTGPASTALIRKSEESIICVIASGSDRFVLRQLIHRTPSLSFGGLECIDRKQIDPVYWSLLPTRRETIDPEEVEELNAIFGKDGELSARWL